MKRRTVLVAAGTPALTLAGCVERSNATDENPTGTPPEGTSTDSGPGEGDGTPLEGVPCPSFSDTADRTVCTHTGSDSEAVYPTVSKEVFTPTAGDDSVEMMQISLHNDSDEAFGLNPHAWALKRRTDDGWSHVAPEEHIEPWQTLESGESFTWDLSVQSHPSPGGKNTLSLIEDLDSGTYAFQSTGVLNEQTAEDSDGDRTETHLECIALFGVNRR